MTTPSKTTFPDFATVRECHMAYLALTGTSERTCPLTLEHTRWWELLLVNRYTLADIRMVVKFVMSEKKKRDWSWKMISLDVMIGSLEEFQKWLQQAEAAARERRVAGDPARARVLAQSGRSGSPSADTGQVKTPGDVLSKGYEELRKAAGL